ncbi:toprim domain-containing protein [Acetobacteraceae bacterium H6797]|nr:toprim domain-containing protein [Acetobacteraceae bacterium H6797]
MSTSFSGAELAARLSLRRSYGGAWRGNCPACGYAGTFSVKQEGGRALWWCASCQDQAALSAAVAAAMGEAWTPPPPRETKRELAHPGSHTQRKQAWARQLWNDGLPIAGSPAERYLEARGVLTAWRAFPMPAEGEQLRFHPAAPHPATGGERLPAMLALLRRATDGEPVAVHRTYLRPDGSGKAEVEPAKATLGPVAGGVVMLHGAPAGEAPLVIGEGIESALAASLLLGAPAWSATAAGNLGALALPPLPALNTLLIAADADPPGEAAAWASTQRWRGEGRSVRIAKPNRPGDDFADIAARRRKD